MSYTSQQASLHSIHLWKGFSRMGEPSAAENHAFNGHLGLTEHIANHGAIVGEIYQALSAAHESFPDVFEYQVTAAMGTWLRENLQADRAAFCAELKKRTEAFMQEPCPFLDEVIEGIVSGVDPSESDLLALATTALVDLSNGYPEQEIAAVYGTGLKTLIGELARFQRKHGYDDDGTWGEVVNEVPAG